MDEIATYFIMGKPRWSAPSLSTTCCRLCSIQLLVMSLLCFVAWVPVYIVWGGGRVMVDLGMTGTLLKIWVYSMISF